MRDFVLNHPYLMTFLFDVKGLIFSLAYCFVFAFAIYSAWDSAMKGKRWSTACLIALAILAGTSMVKTVVES